MTTSPSRLTEMLRQVCLALQGQGISHALVGGMAVAAYGVLRATKDIDFLLDVQDRDKADVALSKLGFRAEVSTPGFARYVRRPVAGLPELTEWADLLFASHATGRTLIEQAQLAPLNPDGSEMVSLVSLEGLVLMKLLACVDDPARLQDRGDIIALLRIHSERVDRDWVLHTARQIEPGYAKAFAAIAAIADAGELGPTGAGTSVL